tara:strand:+ start:460 stop:729 length:270 start_codon:yes stop_codon:yes gene_type:complete
MNYCCYCNYQIYPKRLDCKIKNLQGEYLIVKGDLYCSKDCFSMSIIDDIDDIDFNNLGNNEKQRSCNLKIKISDKYNKSEKNELNNKKK